MLDFLSVLKPNWISESRDSQTGSRMTLIYRPFCREIISIGKSVSIYISPGCIWRIISRYFRQENETKRQIKNTTKSTYTKKKKKRKGIVTDSRGTNCRLPAVYVVYNAAAVLLLLSMLLSQSISLLLLSSKDYERILLRKGWTRTWENNKTRGRIFKSLRKISYLCRTLDYCKMKIRQIIKVT